MSTLKRKSRLFDELFTPGYHELYQNGRVRTSNDENFVTMTNFPFHWMTRCQSSPSNGQTSHHWNHSGSGTFFAAGLPVFVVHEWWAYRTVLTALGWGLLGQFSRFRYFPNFSSLSKHTLAVKYRVYIWHVSPQLSCGDTCQMSMWFEESNMYFCKIENFASGEINERNFSNPHPCLVARSIVC